MAGADKLGYIDDNRASLDKGRKGSDMIGATMAVLLAGPTATTPPASASDLPGIWSLGETRNYATGPAWVFLADGYYAEVTLPDRGPSATGIWKDEGAAIAYTHSHLPFPDMLTPNEPTRLTIEQRTTDKLVTRNYRGVERIFHRCPTNALKAPAGQGEH